MAAVSQARTNSGFGSMTFLGAVDHTGEFSGESPDLVVQDDVDESVLDLARSTYGDDVLFVVHRDFNHNAVVYQANRSDDGNLNPTKPIKVFWMMRNSEEDDGSRVEALTILEKPIYGFKTKRVANNMVVGSVSALGGENITVFQHGSGRFRAGVQFQGESNILERIMAFTEPRIGGSFPAVKQLHITATNSSGRSTTLYFNP